MNDSVLNTIKQMLGITEEQTDFDTDIIIHINTVFNILHQLGVTEDWIQIEDPSTKWEDVVEDISKVNMIKSYVYSKVRLMFDPPLNSTVISAMERQIQEMEFRLLENYNDTKGANT